MNTEQPHTTKGTFTIIWILLLSLTAIGYFASEDWFTGRKLAFALMLFTAVKFLGVSFWFMEMKHAHSAWKWILIAVLVVFGGLIIATS